MEFVVFVSVWKTLFTSHAASDAQQDAETRYQNVT
jgi:hypothetical protein